MATRKRLTVPIPFVDVRSPAAWRKDGRRRCTTSATSSRCCRISSRATASSPESMAARTLRCSSWSRARSSKIVRIARCSAACTESSESSTSCRMPCPLAAGDPQVERGVRLVQPAVVTVQVPFGQVERLAQPVDRGAVAVLGGEPGQVGLDQHAGVEQLRRLRAVERRGVGVGDDDPVEPRRSRTCRSRAGCRSPRSPGGGAGPHGSWGWRPRTVRRARGPPAAGRPARGGRRGSGRRSGRSTHRTNWAAGPCPPAFPRPSRPRSSCSPPCYECARD